MPNKSNEALEIKQTFIVLTAPFIAIGTSSSSSYQKIWAGHQT